MLAIDLFCGLGGWAEGFLSEGYEVVGFDLEKHDYGTGVYPGQLVIQDVMTVHGKRFKEASVIVASPPCQGYSYRAMPWSRAKALPPPDNSLFESCFRIQTEASEAAGRVVPLIVENVRGAQKWVGRARWHYGSFYLWGDVPALMLIGSKFKASGLNWSDQTKKGQDFTRVAGRQSLHSDRDSMGVKQHGSGPIWFRTGNGSLPSKSLRRKAASAEIAKIPFPLAQHIARCFKSS